jgi:hypothetical protein
MTASPAEAPAEKITPVAGPALLELTAKLSREGKTEREIGEAAGYYSINPEGERRVKLLRFRRALNEANGLFLRTGAGNGASGPGVLTTNKAGQLLVGPRYTRQFGSEPGVPFTVEVVGEQIILTLAPAGTVASTEGGDDDEEELTTAPPAATPTPLPAGYAQPAYAAA